jgi:small subunit ribosomal protein S20
MVSSIAGNRSLCYHAPSRPRHTPLRGAAADTLPTRGLNLATKPRGWTGARTPSALKRVRTADRRETINTPRRSAAKTFVARALRIAASPDGGDPAAALAEAMSALDKAAKTGAIHRNAAARRKSRLALKVNDALGGAPVQAAASKTTGRAAASKAAKARVAAARATKAKGAQTAAGKARAALSKTARTEAGRSSAAGSAEGATTTGRSSRTAATRSPAAAKPSRPAAKATKPKTQSRPRKKPEA